jgi:GST-like protein
MEVKRQLDVLDKQLAHNEFIAGSKYSIADMAIFPWYGVLCLGKLYEAAEFLQVHEYTHIVRWAKQLAGRPAVIKGRVVNKVWGDDEYQLKERHSDADFAKLIK